MTVTTYACPPLQATPAEPYVPVLTAGRDAAYTAETVSGAAGFLALRTMWMRLESAAPEITPFQSFPFLEAWARHFGENGSDRLHTVLVREHGRPVATLPLAVRRKGMVRVAEIMGAPLAQYADALVDPVTDAAAAMTAAWAEVRRARIADVVLLRRAQESASVLAAADSGLRPLGEPDRAPFAPIGAFAGHEAFVASLKKPMRKSLRYRRRGLEEAGDVRFEALSGGEAARAIAAEAIDMKRAWLVGRGAVSSAFCDPRTRVCLLDMAADGAAGAVAFRLSVNGGTAAAGLGFGVGRRFCLYLITYAPAYAHLSPGLMLIDGAALHAQAFGYGTFDMLPPAADYKQDWCADSVAVSDHALALTLLGQAYVHVWRQRLRSAAARAWTALPPGMTRILACRALKI